MPYRSCERRKSAMALLVGGTAFDRETFVISLPYVNFAGMI
jgi:hypothetical protein